MPQVIYIPNKCIGCGICAVELPQVWQMNSNTGKAELLDGEFKKDHYFKKLWPDEAKKTSHIAQKCPTKAIKIQ